jgi:transposase
MPGCSGWPTSRPPGRAKSDALDAVRAGREALAREHLTSPHQRGHREALRVLHITRAGIVQAGADARRQLKAPIVTAPEPPRDRLRGRPWRQQVGACAGLVALPSDPVEHRATMRALALTAQRALAARQEAEQLEAELRGSSWTWRRHCSPSPGSDLSAPPSC